MRCFTRANCTRATSTQVINTRAISVGDRAIASVMVESAADLAAIGLTFLPIPLAANILASMSV